MLNDMLFCIPAEMHEEGALKQQLEAHPNIKFVSLIGLDIFGRDTDERIPISVMFDDFEKFVGVGVQTDGSSVLLPEIADISDARLDLLPDMESKWFVDYNYENIDEVTGLPVGTIRIPAYLVHGAHAHSVGSRAILRDSLEVVKKGIVDAIRENPYVLEYLPFDSADDIAEITLTSATEIEFYVQTPHEDADKEKLHVSQEMKESYWKRLVGPVRTAMEKTLELLDHYEVSIEMGHKEVGGVKPVVVQGGSFEHIMEQCEIDFKYAAPIQACDNEGLVRNLIKDTFRRNGLDVTFMAKPVEGAAGSGKHTHLGVAAKLKDGRRVNLFTALDPTKDYMSPIGYGALMGLLRNYEIINPIVSCTNDAFNRLKPGFEAPVCIVTSLGHEVMVPSRNRTVLAGLIRDVANPMATRFELRAPNAKSNTYLVAAAGFLCILDGIRAALAAHKTPDDLCKSISKAYGEEDFYLEKDRIYRAENNIFEDYNAAERDKLFGKAPATVWENLQGFEDKKKLSILFEGDAFEEIDIRSFRTAALDLWSMELKDRIIPAYRDSIIACKKLHHEDACTDLDNLRWQNINAKRKELMRDSMNYHSKLTQLREAIEECDYDKASEMQLELAKEVSELEKMYNTYTRNLMF